MGIHLHAYGKVIVFMCLEEVPPIAPLSRTGPTVGNDDEGEIERRGRGDYQTSEGVDERVDYES